MSTIVTSRNVAALRAGQIGIWGGIVGAAQALALLLAPAAVGEDRYSYPFTPGIWSVAQLTFVVQHLALIAGVTALLAVVRSRLGRAGLWVTVVGLALLTVMEALAITAADEPVDGAWAGVVDMLYSVPSIVSGVGLVVAGVGIARERSLPGWERWVTLVAGIYVFLVLVPGIMAPFAVGRIVIGVWMLLFSAMAWAAVRRLR